VRGPESGKKVRKEKFRSSRSEGGQGKGSKTRVHSRQDCKPICHRTPVGRPTVLCHNPRKKEGMCSVPNRRKRGGSERVCWTLRKTKVKERVVMASRAPCEKGLERNSTLRRTQKKKVRLGLAAPDLRQGIDRGKIPRPPLIAR